MKKLTLNANQLKWIAVVAMLFDHIGASIDISLGNMQINPLLRIIGRLTMPIMCYFIAEGYSKTRNVKKYALRLLVFALAAEMPFRLLFPEFGANVIFTLLAGLLALWVYDKVSPDSQVFGVVCVILIAFACELDTFITLLPVRLATDYGASGVVAIFLCGRLKQSLKPFVPFACLYASQILNVVVITVFLLLDAQWVAGMGITWVDILLQIMYCVAAFATAFLLKAYNGERGQTNKYLFYIFYPGHMLILWMIKTYVLNII